MYTLLRRFEFSLIGVISVVKRETTPAGTLFREYQALARLLASRVVDEFMAEHGLFLLRCRSDNS